MLLATSMTKLGNARDMVSQAAGSASTKSTWGLGSSGRAPSPACRGDGSRKAPGNPLGSVDQPRRLDREPHQAVAHQVVGGVSADMARPSIT